jgi:hypothetical protein
MATMAEILTALGGYNTQGTGTLPGGSSAGAFNSPSPTVAPASTTTTTDPTTTAAENTPTPATTTTTGTGTNLAPDSTNQFGWNLGTLDLVLGGVKTIGGLWAAWQQNKLAKQQLAMQKETTNINLANQISAYNTALEDKTRHRASYQELPQSESDAYLASHKLANRQIA